MSAADKLAQALAEHSDYTPDDDSSGDVCAGCFERLDPDGDSHAGSLAGLRKHQAAVVLAHLTAEGWAQGREEWGVRDADDPHLVQFYDDEQGARRRARLVLGGQPGTLLHRRVTPWKPVETGDQE